MKTTWFQDFRLVDIGRLAYEQALQIQESLVNKRIVGFSHDCLVIGEHPPVVTIGRSGSLKDLRVSKEALQEKGVNVYHVDSGGMATSHGPGQLVVYPILKLKKRDLHLYLQTVTDVIAALLQTYGLNPEFKRGSPVFGWVLPR